ncbi:MAG: hypothetical protein ACTSRZ_11500 [Promethearchaeota archaeon]
MFDFLQNNNNILLTKSQNINKTEDISHIFGSGDGPASYKINDQIYISNEQFDDSDISPWTKETPSGTSISVSSNTLTLTVDVSTGRDINKCPKIILDPTPFYEGNLTIKWRGGDLESLDQLEIRYMNTATTWPNAQVLASYSGANWQTETFQLSDAIHQTAKDEFKIAIILKADAPLTGHDYGYLDFVTLNTFEFIIQEENGDTIPQQNSQSIKAFVYPKDTGFYSDQVKLQYKINDPNLDSFSTEIAYDSLVNGWYTFTIPENAFGYDDICYYRIKSSGSGGTGWTSYSDDYQTTYFSAIDNTNPSFGSISYNPTAPEYNQTIQFSVDCSEISGDSGINSLIMYISNSSGGTTSDYAINPIESLPSQGGTFHFQISNHLTKYNILYYFIRAIDGKGHIIDTAENSITIYDSFPPQVYEYPENEEDQNYLDDNYLLFDIIEPNDASNLNLTSIQLRYSADSTLATNYTDISYSSISGNTFNFTIPSSAYAGNNRIYYRLYVEDNAGNSISTTIKSFSIKDLEPPSLSIYAPESNYTNNPKFYNDVKISFTTDDVGGGSGWKDIYLLINNGTNPLNSLQTSVNLTKESIGGNNYRFLIKSEYLSARQDLFWLATSIDNNGNMRNLTGSFEVFDNVNPKIDFSNISPGNQINHNENAHLYFSISEGIAESGFNLTSNCIGLYIKLNSVPLNKTDGTLIPYNISTPFGGLIDIILDESNYTYGDKVYFWANITDLYGNSNDTFSQLQFFDVIDNVGPYIDVDPQSFNAINYDSNKIINFSIYEPLDGAGLKNVSLYWKSGDSNVSPSSYEGMKSMSIAGFGGDYSFNLLNNEFIAIYNQSIYFIIKGEDVLGNIRTTPIYSFKVDDFIDPICLEDSINGLDVLNNFGKNFSVQVYDPDYPISSGISTIKLYYRINNSNIGINLGEYDGILNVYEAIFPSLRNYTIVLDSILTSAWKNGTKFYYKIYVEDIAGNTNFPENAEMFYIIKGFSVEVESPYISNENSREFWHNKQYIQLVVGFGEICDVWYSIDGQNAISSIETALLNENITGLNEGIHELKVYFFNEAHFILINFGIDITSPKPVQNVRAELSGDIIQVRWDPSVDEDSLSYYEIWRREGNGEFKLLNTLDVNSHYYADIGIKAGTKYEYKIVIVDRAGNRSEFSEGAVIKTKMPSWFYLLIFASLAIATLLSYRIVRNVRNSRTLKTLATMTDEERDEFFKYKEAEETVAILGEESKETAKTKIPKKSAKKKEFEEIFKDKSEIEKQVWQEADWKVKALYLEKTKKYWEENMINLMEHGIRAELEGNLADAWKYFKLAYRFAEKNKDLDLDIFDFLRKKRSTIFQNLYSKK